MNKKAKALIKELANEAKQRLKNFSYTSKEENLIQEKNIERRNELRLLYSRECRKPEITIKIINDSVNDENFKNRVYALLNDNEDLINPLGKLVDKEVYENFNEVEQEKYILELAEKYNKVKETYYQTTAL